MRTLLALAVALLALPACAQTAPAALLDPSPTARMASAPDTPPRPAEAPTPAEARVREIIGAEGIHVVHFWAPWCGNSTGELSKGWFEVVEAHPEVSFTFVTVWNDGEDGAETLRRYAIPDRVDVLSQPDEGPSGIQENRRRVFLGLPMTWVPTTWVFNRNGTLAYAFNYGEVEMAQVAQAIADAGREW